MRTVDEQVRHVLGGVAPLQAMSVSLLESSGSYLAADVIARRPLVDDRLVLARGEKVTTRQLARLASEGIAAVEVAPPPRVVVVGVGDHGVDAGLVHWNALVLASAAQEAGGQVYRAAHANVLTRPLRQTIEDQLVRADLVILVGADATAYGEIQRALGELGGVEFSRVAMSPGGMVGVGRIGDDSTPVLVLPGEPLAAYVTFEVFVRPLIRVLAADPAPMRLSVRTRAEAGWVSTPDAQEYRFGRVDVLDGVYAFTPSPEAEPLAVLAASSALACVPVGVGVVDVGDSVLVIPLEGPGSA